MLFDVYLTYIMQPFQLTLRSITFKYIMNYVKKQVKMFFVARNQGVFFRAVFL